jgi:glutaredoxin
MTTGIPIVYTLTVCPACDALRAEWGRQGIEYDERRVDQSQDTLEEALDYGESVPIIVYPDGRVVEGFDGEIG